MKSVKIIHSYSLLFIRVLSGDTWSAPGSSWPFCRHATASSPTRCTCHRVLFSSRRREVCLLSTPEVPALPRSLSPSALPQHFWLRSLNIRKIANFHPVRSSLHHQVGFKKLFNSGAGESDCPCHGLVRRRRQMPVAWSQ